MCVLKMKFLSSTVQKLSSEQTHRQTDGQTDGQTDRHTERKTDRHTDRQTDSTEIITYPHTRMVTSLTHPGRGSEVPWLNRSTC